MEGIAFFSSLKKYHGEKTSKKRSNSICFRNTKCFFSVAFFFCFFYRVTEFEAHRESVRKFSSLFKHTNPFELTILLHVIRAKCIPLCYIIFKNII